MFNIEKDSFVRVSRLENEDQWSGIKMWDLYKVVTPYGDNSEDTAVVQCVKVLDNTKNSTGVLEETIQRFWVSQLINDKDFITSKKRLWIAHYTQFGGESGTDAVTDDMNKLMDFVEEQVLQDVYIFEDLSEEDQVEMSIEDKKNKLKAIFSLPDNKWMDMFRNVEIEEVAML